MKKISIGLLSYKRTDLLIETLTDLLNVSTEVDIIVVNNNENIEIVNDINFIRSNENINLKYIWDKKNYGVAHGRNKIVENLETEYLIILDDDVYIEDINIIIENTIRIFDSDKDIGALAFHIKDYKTKIPNRYEIPHKNKNIDMSNDFYTYLVIGAGHAVRKSVFKDVGTYPKDFGLYGMEEIDLAYRIIGSGKKIKFISNNIIYHKKSPDGRFSNQEINYRYFVNRLKISINYFKCYYVLSTVIIWSSFYLIKTKNFKGLINGLVEAFKNIKTRKPFDSTFYEYIKKVDGRLWY